MKIQVLFFGMAKDLAGQSASIMELDEGNNVDHFRKMLINKYPSFTKMDSFAVAVNESYAEEGLIWSNNDTVAIIPPVSGG